MNDATSNGPSLSRGVQITGWGAVSAFGTGVQALWQAAERGESGVRPVTRFDTTALEHPLAALVPGWDEPAMGVEVDGRAAELAVAFARAAGLEAIQRSGVLQRAAPERVALVLGTNLEDRPVDYATLARRVARALGVTGPSVVVSVACASATSALGVASELLLRGDADAVLAGGTDCITPRVMAGFKVLGALSKERSRPFSQPHGMSLGDGAGLLVLERGEGDCALLGWGLSADAHHPTAPAPDGAGVSLAVSSALGHAGVSPDSVGYVNAHGTGTAANDAPEWTGLSRVLPAQTPCSSSKGLIGHAQGAAGALELILTLEARARGVLLPTWGFRTPRVGAPPDPVPSPRAGPSDVALSCNAAFGGANSVVVVGRSGRASPPRRPLYIHGVGLVGPHGLGEEGLEPGQRGPLDLGAVARQLRRVDSSRMDPSTLCLTAAADQALRDGRLRLSRALRDRVGLVVGQHQVSQVSVQRLQRSIEQRGLAQLNAAAFSRALLISPAGACSRALGLRGPINALSAGRASGLLALVHAAELLMRPSLSAMLAMSTDEWRVPDDLDTSQERPEGAFEHWEGSAGVLLAPDPRSWRLAGWAVGPDAEAKALQRAGLDQIDQVFGHEVAAGPVGSLGLLGLCLARYSPSALVVAEEPGLLKVAVALVQEEVGGERAS